REALAGLGLLAPLLLLFPLGEVLGFAPPRGVEPRAGRVGFGVEHLAEARLGFLRFFGERRLEPRARRLGFLLGGFLAPLLGRFRLLGLSAAGAQARRFVFLRELLLQPALGFGAFFLRRRLPPEL